ncbi:helix-turn-helix domain-containing protein [Nitratifractor salsuginis]|uniref:Helix-turn-helix domain-containing protein n=1 Tax=Nitratifractor salsuginis (strain DSM 16511 / JCM 12458 / E9I37-1) TaxID=749222 RepID=E6WZ45_NITSE|nr:hypothetical protein Nitsa_0223 [Nitratifractor salsuginis DSM 16511]
MEELRNSKPTENLQDLQNFRPAEAARFLRISLSQLWNLIKAGKIRTVKLSKQVTIIRRAELETFLDKATRTVQP